MKYFIVFSIFILIICLMYIIISSGEGFIYYISTVLTLILYGILKGILNVVNERGFFSFYLNISFLLLLGLLASKYVDYTIIKLIIMVSIFLIYEVALNLGLSYSRRNNKNLKKGVN